MGSYFGNIQYLKIHYDWVGQNVLAIPNLADPVFNTLENYHNSFELT